MKDVFAAEAGSLQQEARDYLGCLLEADHTAAGQIITQALNQGNSIENIYIHIFQSSQHEVGRLWQTNQINVAQEHYCTAATQNIMSQLYPQIFKSTKNGLRLIATCVNGELHELGIRMVADFFEMAGWSTYFLGADTPLPSLIQSIKQYHADLLCVSATISYNIGALSELVGSIRSSREIAETKIMIGGRPFIVDPGLWQKIGADGFALDARQALPVASRLFKTIE
jgi:MerR family transcriptional regulator, light-induced transcriptional regulator